MISVDLALPGTEPLLRQDCKLDCFPGGECAAVRDFKSVLAGLGCKSKNDTCGEAPAEAAAAAADQEEPLPDEGEETGPDGEAVFFPIAAEGEWNPGAEPMPRCSPAAPPPEPDCAGGLSLFPAALTEGFLPVGEARRGVPAPLSSEGEDFPASTKLYSCHESPESAEQAAGPLAAADPFSPEGDISFLDRARAVRPPQGGDSLRPPFSGSIVKGETPLQVSAAPEMGEEIMAGPECSMENAEAGGPGSSQAPQRMADQGSSGPLFLSPGAEEPADRAGADRLPPAQPLVESRAAANSPPAPAEAGIAALEQGPATTGLPAANRGVLDQLCRCCASLPKRADLPAEIRLALNPPELGELLIRVVSREGRLSARIIVEALSVKEMLVNNLQELHERLGQSDLYLDRIDLLTAGEMSLDDHRFKKGDYRGLWMDENSAAAILREEANPGMAGVMELHHDGAVNYWA